MEAQNKMCKVAWETVMLIEQAIFPEAWGRFQGAGVQSRGFLSSSALLILPSLSPFLYLSSAIDFCHLHPFPAPSSTDGEACLFVGFLLGLLYSHRMIDRIFKVFAYVVFCLFRSDLLSSDYVEIHFEKEKPVLSKVGCAALLRSGF